MARHYSDSPKESHGGSEDPKRYKGHKRGMEGHMYKPGKEEVAGTDPRRTDEMQAAGMIHMDPHAIANLPQNVMIKPYPKAGPYMPEGLDDTIAGIDRQMDYDDDKRRDTMYPKKV
jgi:hypothetical protein